MGLNNYSWQDFLLAATALLVLWYLGLWWCYRRRKAGAMADSAVPLPHGWQDGVDRLDGADEVMGVTKLDHGVSVVAADDFRFEQVEDVGGRQEKLGLVPDVQQEIKSICSLLAVNDGTKEDFFSMFELLVKDKYSRVPASAQAGLSEYIREHVPFYLTIEELESLWS